MYKKGYNRKSKKKGNPPVKTSPPKMGSWQKSIRAHAKRLRSGRKYGKRS